MDEGHTPPRAEGVRRIAVALAAHPPPGMGHGAHAGNCQLGRTHNSDVFARRFEPASTPALTAERRPHARVAPRLVTIGCGGYDARCISRPDPTGTPGTGFRPTRGALRGAPDGARRRDARRASGGTAGTAREAGSAARAAQLERPGASSRGLGLTRSKEESNNHKTKYRSR